MINLNPIILFTYRRVPKESIESLLKNILSSKSKLFIFSDGYKGNIDKQDVLEVRNYLKTVSGFKAVVIYESDNNKGLADSIISGVTEVISKYKQAIILEDDVVVTNDFLEYMNDALEFYKDDKKIWSISGYTPHLKSLENHKKDIYLTQRGTSWAWATWIDRWEKIDWGITNWDEFKKDKKAIEKFKLSGNDMYKMLELQMLGKLDSWAIRWDFNQYTNKMYTVFPKCSKAINIGFEDEKSTNTSGKKMDRFNVELYEETLKLESIDSSKKILKEFKQIHDIGLYTNIGYFLKKHGGYKFIKKLLKILNG